MNTSTDSKHFFSKDYYILGVGIISFLIAGSIHSHYKRPITTLSKQDTALNINKHLLVFLSAGNKRLFTDLLWVQTLIESDLEHYKKKDLNSWLYLRFDTIAQLDNRFYENYIYGGQFLAIVKDDLEGANDIYRRGVLAYPEDYKLNYNAGFLNYFEIGNSKEGLKYLSKIEDHPSAPVFFKSIVSKLKVETGMDLKEIFQLVLHNYENTPDETLKKRLLADLYSIKAEIDLKCLNNSGQNCELKDLDGMPYLKVRDSYKSAKTFLPYKIKRRNSKLESHATKQIDTIK